MRTRIIERCTNSDIALMITGSDANKILEPLNEYLSNFVKPTGKCFNCGKGTSWSFFEWGLVRGEGVCSTCGWPARAWHYPTYGNGDMLFNRMFEFVLQYHPDNVVCNLEESK